MTTLNGILLILVVVGVGYVIKRMQERRERAEEALERRERQIKEYDELIKQVQDKTIKIVEGYEDAKSNYNRKYHSNDSSNSDGGPTS